MNDSCNRFCFSGRAAWLSGTRHLVMLMTLVCHSWVSRAQLAAAELPKGVEKIASVEGFTEYRLENGLRVVLFPEPSQPKVTVNMTVLVGSRHEGYGETGMAHLLEHMLFKPTEKHPHADRDLQERGAQYNGSTFTDRTNYYETLPASDDNLEYAIALEADRLVNCPIRAEDLSSEMTVVRNEFEMGENDPKGILWQRMLATAFEWHNYGKSTIGNRADIERVPVDNLRAFYKKYYRPDNVVLFIGGRFDEQRALELVQQHFGPIPRPEEPIRSTYTEEPPQDGERQVVLRRVGKVPMAAVMYHIPSAADPDFAAVKVLASILSADKTGRLYKALVERQRAASVSGMAFAWQDPSVMNLSAEVAPNNEPSDVLSAMVDVLQTVADKGVTEEEVTRSKRNILKHWDQLSTDTPALTTELSEWAGAGDWRLLFLYRDRIEQVTVDDVNRVAKKYLQPTNRTLGLYLPTAESDRTKIAATPDIASLVKDYRGRADSSAGEAFDPAPEAIERRVRRSQVDGIKVALLPKKSRGGVVVLQLQLRYGKAESLFGKAEACEFLPDLMTRGTQGRTAEQIQDRLDELQTSLGATGRPGVATFALQTKREQLGAALDLLREILREPSLPEAELGILRRERRSALEEQLAEPQALAPRAVNQLLNPYPVGDVRHVPSLPDELKLVDAVTQAEIRQLYDEFLSAQAGELVVVGDFDEAAVMAEIAKLFAGWKSAQPYERIRRDAKGPEQQQVVKINTPDKANAMYFAGQVMPLSDSDPDYPALIVANEVLGGSGFASRLMNRIREKEGLSYGVGSAFRAEALDPRAVLSIYAIANPQNIEKAAELAQEELARMLKEGITAQELNEAQQGYIQGEVSRRGDDMQLAGLLIGGLYADRTLAFQAQLEKAVTGLTAEQVQGAAAKHFNPARLIQGLAGDFNAK